MIRRLVRWVDSRSGTAPVIRKAMRYVFPDHWSFLLGEIALFSFVVLVATGTFLALFFEPSSATTTYHGAYAPLDGAEVSKAYASAVHLSFEVRAGLLMRQTHHWAALVFVAAITLHLLRIFFTGAFRRPRDLNYLIGLALLGLALLEGFAGYSLPDDLLSGMGLAIAWAVAISIPFIGAWVGLWIWNGEFPGGPAFEPRLYIVHVFVVPAVLAALIGVHLLLIAKPRHTQFRGPGRTERNVAGSPMWPSYVLRSAGLAAAVAGGLFLLGGLVQINPIWQYGPYEPWLGTNGAQPDWYLGWLIGALRLMPPFEPRIGDYTIAGNAFWGGVLFPTFVFGVLVAWPAIERRITGDHAEHHLLDRPRDAPFRTALGAAMVTAVTLTFVAGSTDRVFFELGIPYSGQVWFFRVAFFVLPVIVYWVTKRVCEELSAGELHPLRGFVGTAVRRAPGGGFEAVGAAREAPPEGGGAEEERESS